MITENEQKVYDALSELGIPYSRYEHEPVYTVAEAEQLEADIPGKHCKNLFLRNKKGDAHYLLILEASKRVDLKNLSKQIGSPGLSLASGERLERYLGLKAGSVSPFGLINDHGKQVTVLLDSDIVNSETVNFHPNVNTATLIISYRDFEKFLTWCGNRVCLVDV
jgi:Ala-tRNA(Pro) deacylase